MMVTEIETGPMRERERSRGVMWMMKARSRVGRQSQRLW